MLHDLHGSLHSLLTSLQVPQVAGSFTTAFETAGDQVMQERQALSAALVAELAERCSAGLSQLRGITAMYRMSARPAPTR